MKSLRVIGIGVLIFAFSSSIVIAAEPQIRFDDTDYQFRWSKNTQFEFTPKGQEDLSSWVDMMTINYYTDVSDGEGLASIANKVLTIYNQSGGKLILTNSVPRTKEKPAEYLIVFVMGQKGFLEFVQARFKIVDGVGSGIVYSHRVYGEKAGPEMSKWMELNGPSLGEKLMSLKEIPAYEKLSKIKSS